MTIHNHALMQSRRSIVVSILTVALVAMAVAAESDDPAAVEPQTDSSMKPYTEEIRYGGKTARFEMIPIPGGRFKMGSPAGEEDRNDDEGPQVYAERCEAGCRIDTTGKVGETEPHHAWCRMSSRTSSVRTTGL